VTFFLAHPVNGAQKDRENALRPARGMGMAVEQRVPTTRVSPTEGIRFRDARFCRQRAFTEIRVLTCIPVTQAVLADWRTANGTVLGAGGTLA